VILNGFKENGFMTISSSTDGDKQIINIQGRFDFSLQNDFRKAYEKSVPSSYFVLDFSAAEYIDSSALGMLLLFRDYAGGDSANIDIMHCRSEIKAILKISNFQKLFQIS
jgi:HptB-dependent secretion and biofilm anti anti-sigma factor